MIMSNYEGHKFEILQHLSPKIKVTRCTYGSVKLKFGINFPTCLTGPS